MVVILEKLFIAQLYRCPADFQQKFRKIYQQLKVVDNPSEVKAVTQIEKKLFKLTIDKSRIALRTDGHTLTIGCFLYNQFYKSPD